MAVINVDLSRVVGDVDRRILGGFTEHLGRCIYGGVFDPGSPLADTEGYRTDVLEAVRRLRPPVLRWPGGNFVSGYHWADGIGPLDRRPRRMELAWGAEESNRFGTDEFMRYCELVDAEPYVCLNMGTGSVDEAQAWLEYCNGTGNTYWADLRRANGHEAPYRVRYWGLGNEVYGDWQIGQRSASDYVTTARQWAKLLTRTDPNIELVSCGKTGWSDWDQQVIEGLAELVRWHSLHIYTGSEDYWRNVLSPHQVERAARVTSALIEKVCYNKGIAHKIYIAYDEWNVWFREQDGSAGLEERYTLADALAVATYLHGFVRHARVIKMANLAQLVNVIAPIVTSPDGMLLQSIYHPLRLFADHLGDQSLDVQVECDRHEMTDDLTGERWAYRVADMGPFPVLDVVATLSTDDRKLLVSVVNRSPDQDVTAELRFANVNPAGSARVEEVNASDWGSANSFANPHLVKVTEGTLDKLETGVQYCFPCHSMTAISATL